MLENKFFNGLSKIQEICSDVAKISSNEIKSGLSEAKTQIKKYRIVQKRKELMSLLGQYTYEFYQDFPDSKSNDFLNALEIKEILEHISKIDIILNNLNKEKFANGQTQE